MSDQTLFDDSNSASDDNQDTNSNQQNSQDQGHDLIGEGKKYATQDEANNALVYSQTHISNIEAENKLLREKSEATTDLLAEIKKSKEAAPKTDEVDFDKLVDDKLNQRFAQDTATSNLQAVDVKMKGVFGNDKAKELMKLKATELNMTLAEMQKVAEQSPNAFLAWFDFGGENANAQSNLDNSDVNTETFNQDQHHTQIKVDTYAYFEKMRKEDPSQYYDSKVQFRMTQLAANPDFMKGV